VVLGPEIVQQTTEKIKMIQEKMRASQIRQKSYADKRRSRIFESHIDCGNRTCFEV
ncbi:hypothetical protein A2U01_0115515, partial [Trifolium medium]|nr:hypothetical protein [Trifolium medium]